jgi:LL-diaminopimelate aminotransferase
MPKLFAPSYRIQHLKPYIFAKIDQLKQKALAEGKTLYPLGIGDPDLPTPDFILDALSTSIQKPENQKYPSYQGKPAFRKAASDWIMNRFGVHFDPDLETLAVIGTKEGLAHFPLAVINPLDKVLVPDIGYPVYTSSTLFAGAEPIAFTLNQMTGLPDFAELEDLMRVHPTIKMIFLNYPNNPTADVAPVGFFEEMVAFAKKHEIIVCHDMAYSEIYFDNQKPASIFQAKGAKDVAIEFHSLSKTFNMTGFRVGFAIGNPDLISYLSVIKTNIDSGVFNACQDAGIAALQDKSDFCDKLRGQYQQRRDLLVPALQKLGLQCKMPAATFYVWAKLPNNTRSDDFAFQLIEKKGIICTPGTGFGDAGEGFVRFTLCMDLPMLKKVVALLQNPL